MKFLSIAILSEALTTIEACDFATEQDMAFQSEQQFMRYISLNEF